MGKSPAQYRALKITSIILMVCAIGVELWNVSAHPLTRLSPVPFPFIVKLVTIVLIIHVLEGAIAALLARSRTKQPLRYGLYTFWVGLPGILELIQLDAIPPSETAP